MMKIIVSLKETTILEEKILNLSYLEHTLIILIKIMIMIKTVYIMMMKIWDNTKMAIMKITILTCREKSNLQLVTIQI